MDDAIAMVMNEVIGESWDASESAKSSMPVPTAAKDAKTK